jgi:hypothetical protein
VWVSKTDQPRYWLNARWNTLTYILNKVHAPDDVSAFPSFPLSGGRFPTLYLWGWWLIVVPVSPLCPCQCILCNRLLLTHKRGRFSMWQLTRCLCMLRGQSLELVPFFKSGVQVPLAYGFLALDSFALTFLSWSPAHSKVMLTDCSSPRSFPPPKVNEYCVPAKNEEASSCC